MKLSRTHISLKLFINGVESYLNLCRNYFQLKTILHLTLGPMHVNSYAFTQIIREDGLGFMLDDNCYIEI